MAVGEGSEELDENNSPVIQHHEPTEEMETTTAGSEPESDEDEEEEPRLKYANLTKDLTSLYRNGDFATAFFVAGDKIVVGTQNGNIHVLILPTLETLKSYKAHSASISSISISPYPPPSAALRGDTVQRLTAETGQDRGGSDGGSPTPKSSPRKPPVPANASNQIHIATSSIDGNVCVASLIDEKDVQLRNFGRPIQTVGLSPEYRTDRSYLSGGQAGSLILTSGGQAGRSANATTSGAGAAASGWLGSIGLGSSTGYDKVLHSGEGIISMVRWSLSGRYVLWVNEHGIRIMRSNLHIEFSEGGTEWKRIGFEPRPDRGAWEDMAGVWKARAEWIDRKNLESDDDPSSASVNPNSNGTAPATPDNKSPARKPEEVIVGWGDTTWLIRVHVALDTDGGINKNKKPVEIMKRIIFDDCTISGISLYTPKLLLVLAYMERKQSIAVSDGTKRGRRHRHDALEPELRLIDIETKEEVDSDTLTISRFETLSSADYHIGILPPMRVAAGMVQRGYLSSLGSGMTSLGSGMTAGMAAVGTGFYTGVETVGQGMWDATMYGPRKLGAAKIFSTTDSVRSGNVDSDKAVSVRERNYLTGWLPGFGLASAQENDEVRDVAQTQGMKIFIFSPYDCIVAVRRNLADRLRWLLSLSRFKEAWELLNEHPDAPGAATDSSDDSTPPTPSKASSIARSGVAATPNAAGAQPQATLAEFFAESTSITSSAKDRPRDKNVAAEKEKRRVGELWLKQLTSSRAWTEAGEVARKVLNTSTRWEHWVWIFIKNNKFDEISTHIPTLDLTPPLPSLVFEIILGHYMSTDREQFKKLLDYWPSDLFEISSITTAVQDQLRSDGTKTDSEDWRILQECLAKLFLADGRYDEALKCYIRVHDADTALSLVKEHHLIGAITHDVPSFIQLRITAEQLKFSSTNELEELASEPVRLLVDEADNGAIDPVTVVQQLDTPKLRVFLFFYFRALWRGEGTEQTQQTSLVGYSAAANSLVADAGKILVEQYADLALELFSEYDLAMLTEFLHTSTAYDYEQAVQICDQKHYFSELVYLLSKTGRVRKALYLIIDELHDVKKAIEFAKEQDDKDLWDDFLEYSMSRPRFIAGLLAEVGTAVNPIELVKKIPSGLEIQGLKDGLKKMIREYDLQDSISSGVAQVLSSEVAISMAKLRHGRQKGIKFEHPRGKHKKQQLSQDSTKTAMNEAIAIETAKMQDVDSGHCASCHRAFHNDEQGTLVGFACGHVYHVSHLLHGPGAEGEEPSGLPRTGDDDDDSVSDTFQRTIGPKVTNARLLKYKIEAVGGCQICKGTREMDNEVS